MQSYCRESGCLNDEMREIASENVGKVKELKVNPEFVDNGN